MIACKDCRFHDDSYGNNCSHPSVMQPHPVYGQALETCHTARSENGKCGVGAKFFAQWRLRDAFTCSHIFNERGPDE